MAYDHSERAVVIAIRGTLSIKVQYLLMRDAKECVILLYIKHNIWSGNSLNCTIINHSNLVAHCTCNYVCRRAVHDLISYI